MKKEMLIAVIIGFLLGLVITYGIYRIRVASNSNVTAVPSPTPGNVLNPGEGDSLITIHSPLEGSIQKEKTATITGSTVPNSFIVLFVNETDYIRQSDSEGNFSFEVPVVDGSNLLSLQLVTNEGITVTKERTLIVTNLYDEVVPSAPAKSSPSASPTPKATIKATSTP